MPIDAATIAGPPTKGERTRASILAAAEEVFGHRGYHDASISEITRLAGVAQGSFYLYFPSKTAIFEELIRTRGKELISLILHDHTVKQGTIIERQTLGFGLFFRWIAEHRWLYRVVRQAEFVNPQLRDVFYGDFASVYERMLADAMDAGHIERSDPAVLAWSVMGMADFTAMRWIVWAGDDAEIKQDQIDDMTRIAMRAIGAVV